MNRCHLLWNEKHLKSLSLFSLSLLLTTRERRPVPFITRTSTGSELYYASVEKEALYYAMVEKERTALMEAVRE